MLPNTFPKWVDLGGVEITSLVDGKIDGLYNKLVEADRQVMLYNFTCCGISIPPSQGLLSIDGDDIIINNSIIVHNNDTVELTRIKLMNKTIVENGSYTPDVGYIGFNKVDVEIPLTQLIVTANGIYTPEAGGYNSVHVNVENAEITPLYTRVHLTSYSASNVQGNIRRRVISRIASYDATGQRGHIYPVSKGNTYVLTMDLKNSGITAGNSVYYTIGFIKTLPDPGIQYDETFDNTFSMQRQWTVGYTNIQVPYVSSLASVLLNDAPDNGYLIISQNYGDLDYHLYQV